MDSKPVPNRETLEYALGQSLQLFYDLQASGLLLGKPLLGRVARQTAVNEDILERCPKQGYCARCGEHCDYC